MLKPASKVSPPQLERASWIAAIASVFLALIFGAYQIFQPNSGAVSTASRNSAPVIIGSPGAQIFVNIPPERARTDQENCNDDERWIGVKPNSASWLGKVDREQAKHAVLYGEFRWSPVLNQTNASTRGDIFIDADGVITKVYEWDSPRDSVHSFQIPIGKLLVGTSGRFSTTWKYRTGSSGICVTESRVGTSINGMRSDDKPLPVSRSTAEMPQPASPTAPEDKPSISSDRRSPQNQQPSLPAQLESARATLDFRKRDLAYRAVACKALGLGDKQTAEVAAREISDNDAASRVLLLTAAQDTGTPGRPRPDLASLCH
jgi:hypothetical protein